MLAGAVERALTFWGRSYKGGWQDQVAQSASLVFGLCFLLFLVVFTAELALGQSRIRVVLQVLRDDFMRIGGLLALFFLVWTGWGMLLALVLAVPLTLWHGQNATLAGVELGIIFAAAYSLAFWRYARAMRPVLQALQPERAWRDAERLSLPQLGQVWLLTAPWLALAPLHLWLMELGVSGYVVSWLVGVVAVSLSSCAYAHAVLALLEEPAPSDESAARVS
ncbi:hypothetical protein D3C72_671020 [compost metagenome]